MSKVSFEATSLEAAVVNVITDRVLAGPSAIVGPRTRLDIEMDLRAVHANGCPLNFQKLLSFEADAIAVLDRTRTTGRAALLPTEDIVANDVAYKRLSDSLRRTA